jgi:hypothetical protein
VQSGDSESDRSMTMTIEAFADTIVPGEKRWPQDVAIAGAAAGGGAVVAGAVELVTTPATGIADGVASLADALNEHARAHAAERGLPLTGLALADEVPPFVALPFAERTALVATLTAPGHGEKDLWILLALFCFMAFDTAAHMHTTDAVSQRHAGLMTMGFAPPDADGLWRFDDYSYGRQLAAVHPDTNSSGSLA